MLSNPCNDRLGKSACSRNFKIILPGQRFHGRMEGACRGIARQIDSNHGGIPKSDSEKDDQRASGLTE